MTILASSRMKVHRKSPVLVPPSSPTPYELKLLSDIDDQDLLRLQVSMIQFYRHNPLISDRDPVLVIKEALGKVLVHYYPFAGRLREAANQKLAVECTGEGILFIEADADARLQDIPDSSKPPYPYLGELLFDVEGSDGMINTPLLLIQVTRLLCGGFIFGIRVNHTMADGVGIVQFLTALAELARGAPQPSVKPIWNRELLRTRNQSQAKGLPRQVEGVLSQIDTPLIDLVEDTLFFGPKEIKNIRDHHLPDYLRNRTTFEIVTACLWKCRTVTLRSDYPDEKVQIYFTFNARSKFNQPIPLGYYGNVIAIQPITATASKLFQNPLSYALEKVKKAKSKVTDEYMRSLVDFLALKNKPLLSEKTSFFVSDVTHIGLETVDFGWGLAIYGGLLCSDVRLRSLSSFYLPSKNANGENGMVVPISLPAAFMDKFIMEIEKYTKQPAEESNN